MTTTNTIDAARVELFDERVAVADLQADVGRTRQATDRKSWPGGPLPRAREGRPQPRHIERHLAGARLPASKTLSRPTSRLSQYAFGYFGCSQHAENTQRSEAAHQEQADQYKRATFLFHGQQIMYALRYILTAPAMTRL